MAILPLLFSLANTIFGKRLADATANYLNQRRQNRLVHSTDKKPLAVQTNFPMPKKIEPRIITVTTPARWHLLSGGIIGAAITIIIGLLWQRRS